MKSNNALHIGILERDNLNTLLSKIFCMSPSLMAVNRLEDHVFLDVNHRFIRFTGYSREEILGHSIPELKILNRDDYERIYQALKTKATVF